MAFQFAGRYIEALLKTSSGTVRLLAGVPVVIRETDGVTLATVYVDRTKAASASNPVVTDARGNLDAWLDPGSYLGYPVIAGVEQPAFPMHVEIDPAEADSPPAAEVSFAPAGGLAAVTVQAALVELDTEKASTASVVAVSAAVDAEEAARIAADALLVPLAEKGAPNGVATLGADSKLTAAQLPDLAISAFLGTTASQAAMLALDGDRGDWTVRTDTDPDTTWMLVADDPTQLANWRQMSTVTDAVSSVNGRLGAVVGLAEAADVTAEAAARVAADALLAPKASPTFTGTVLTPAATVSGKNGLAPRTFTGRKTTVGAPTTGTWAVDDEVIDSAGVLWRCTVAGTPGTWIQVTSSGTTTETLMVALSDETTAITAGAAKVTMRMPFAMTLTAVRASLKTASASGGPVTVDINEEGVSILSTKLTIDDTEDSSLTATTAAVISDAALADDAKITFDIDAAGVGAEGLKVVLIGTRG